MSQFRPNIARQSLRDKVVLVTGGANGIGASLVEYCCENGAYVCFGDTGIAAGEQLSKRLCESDSSSSHPRAIFLRTDVTDYQSLLYLFDAALKAYGCIDHVVAAAGIMEIGNCFDPALDLKTVREAPTTKVLDVNLVGSIYVSRIASVYLRQSRPANTDRSITLFSSLAGFKESPGLFIYQTSKHGILGLMRALRLYLSNSPVHNIRVNVVCPWMTATGMADGVCEGWVKAGLPLNTPLDVAKVTAGLLVDSSLNGKAMYVEGGRAWEIEGNLDRLEPQWLGEEPSRSLAKGQAVLGQGMDWAK